MQSLRHTLPLDYRSWVSVGATLAAAGYGGMALAHLATGQPVLPSEVAVFVLSLVAAALLRWGKNEGAAHLLLMAVVAELLYSYATSPEGIRMVGSFVAPAFIVGVGLFSGARPAVATAIALSVAVPVTVALGGALGSGPGLRPADATPIVALVGSLNTAALLLWVFLRSFGRVVEQSRQHAKQAQGLVEASPDGVLALGADGTLCALNTTAEGLLGVRRDEVMGRRPEEVVGALGAPGLLDPVYEARAPRELVLDSGVILEVATRRLPPGAEPITTLCVLRDVTPRRRAEAFSEELQERLHHAQKLEAIGRLAGGVAHDFNNLLTAIGSHADILVSTDDPEVREIGQELQAVRARGAGLTRQLLAFARREVLQSRPMDVGRVVADSAMLLRRLLGERIELELDLGPCPIVADPGHIEQVVLNLAANARDAMPFGGKFQVSCREVTDDSVELVVSDTGHGIDSSTRNLVFEPFFTTKQPGEGSGLGLSTVHGIVTQYAGTIELKSEVGRGTTFTIRWPRGPVAPPSVRAPAIDPVPTVGAKVLLVEDDAETRRGVRRLLRQAGYAVVDAASPSDALALDGGYSPDVVLSDIVMPGMTGIEFVAEWRRRQPRVSVIFISGYSDDALRMDLGEDGLLRKPFTKAELVAAIERRLNDARSTPRPA